MTRFLTLRSRSRNTPHGEVDLALVRMDAAGDTVGAVDCCYHTTSVLRAARYLKRTGTPINGAIIRWLSAMLRDGTGGCVIERGTGDVGCVPYTHWDHIIRVGVSILH